MHNIFMLLFIQIAFFVYILAINAYGYILVLIKSKEEESGGEKSGYGKFIVAALLGGALGIYVSMFINKFRLDSLLLMVFIPVIIVVNAFIVWQIYVNNFGFIQNPYLMQNIVIF